MCCVSSAWQHIAHGASPIVGLPIVSLAFHAKDGFATGTVGTGTITVIVDSNVCFYMEEENLQIALEKGIIEPAVYERVIAYKERLEENQVPVIYNLRHLRKIFRIYKKEQDFFFGDKKEELYRTFKIPKKSGGYRTIEAPCERLKQIQRWIKDEIIDKLVMSEYATGFRKNLSIVDNAKKHVGKELVIGMDLKDFFPSVTYEEIFLMFRYVGYRKDVAHLLSKLCTNAENVLPQGSPASPSIANHVLLKLDKRLGILAETIGADYSRYADDITFSGKKSIASIIPLVEKIVAEENFTINKTKTRLQYKNQRQEVTGLIVNNKISISREMENEIKNAIYFIGKYGVCEHMRHIECNKSFYKEHLYGIAYFINMGDREKGQKYLRQLDLLEWEY